MIMFCAYICGFLHTFSLPSIYLASIVVYRTKGERALTALNYTHINGKPCRIMWSQRDLAKRKVSGGNIFVKNLDPSVTSKSLHDTFAQYGSILSCKVVTDVQGNSKGYGFVHYDTLDAAENAIRQVNGATVYDREL